jgi:quercetin dioxygenase-like cupin family protein
MRASQQNDRGGRMQVHRKSIRDYVGDVRMTPWDRQTGAPLPTPSTQSNVLIYPTITREVMWGKGVNQSLEVSVYSIAPGEDDPPHYHPDHIEFVICWRGKGTATIAKRKQNNSGWEPAVRFDFQRGDTIVVPKGAIHQFHVEATQKMRIPNPAFPDPPLPNPLPANHPKTKFDWPAEKLELVVIHAPGCVRIPYAAPFPSPQDPQPIHVPVGTELYTFKRPIGEFSGFARDVSLQCVRARIWGREAEDNVNGAADDAKPLLHFTSYPFVPGQENPEHYHPHSVEFVMCMQGRAHMTVRPMIESGNFKAGWEDPYDLAELNEGDTVIVPKGALHRYTNATNEDCVLVALQSPHPILHILEDDAPVELT